MNTLEQRLYLIDYLKKENPLFADMPTPEDTAEQRKFLRALMNIRRPEKISADFFSGAGRLFANDKRRKRRN